MIIIIVIIIITIIIIKNNNNNNNNNKNPPWIVGQLTPGQLPFGKFNYWHGILRLFNILVEFPSTIIVSIT